MMEYKAILAAHMDNANEKDDYLTDNKMGGYIVSNLDLKEVAQYNFDDNNTYVFDNCLLRDINLYFKNNTIIFQNCRLEGNVYIYNRGNEEKGSITFRSNNDTCSLRNLYIKSKKVILNYSDINCIDNLIIEGNICNFDKCNLISPIITVESLVDCNINDSIIENIQIRYNQLMIQNSNINGRNIYKFVPDTLIGLHESGISRSKK